jgi:multidrug efflux pump subunit AcrB
LASLVVAYIFNPVFAVDFMKPHIKGEHDNPKFDKTTKRVMLWFAGIAVIAYLISFGVGNFVVFAAVMYLLNHFVFIKWIDAFQNKAWPKIQTAYANLLEKAVKVPGWILLGTIFLFIFSIFFMVVRSPKVEFFPQADPNFAFVYITLPKGTDQAYTNEVTKILEKRVAQAVEPDKDVVTSIISNVTVSVTDPQDEDQGNYPNKAKIAVAFIKHGLRNGKNTRDIMLKIRKAVTGVIPGVKISVDQESGGPPTQKDISIEIAGDNLDTLVKTANSLKRFIDKRNIGGIEELTADVQDDKPQIVFDIDRERANREGVSSAQISQALATTLYGWKAADFRNTTEEDYEINVRGKEDQRYDLDAIRNLKITYRDMATGGAVRQVPISAFSDIRYANTYSNIKHKQQIRVITLGSNVIKTGNFNANDVNAEIAQAMTDFKTPAGITLRMGGGQEDQTEAAVFLLSALGVSFMLILIILMMQFNSIGKTFIIISEILFSIIGVLLGVSAFGMTFSVLMTGIGIVALAGVVVRNGILLVEFTDLLMSQGQNLHDAVVEAGRTRMTPVLLTATAAILGLVPLAIGFNIDFAGLFTHFQPHIHFGGDNTAFWGPLSWTMIFGLGFATLITLIVVPCMYIIHYNLKQRLFGKKKADKAELKTV